MYANKTISEAMCYARQSQQFKILLAIHGHK